MARQLSPLYLAASILLLLDPGPAPAVVTITTLDAAGDTGFYTSLAIGSDDRGLIAYYGNGYLNVLHCDDSVCASGTIEHLDSESLYPSIAIGIDGLPLISYFAFEGPGLFAGDLKVAHCESIDCQTATITHVDTEGDVGLYSSAAIGSDGLALISYLDSSNGDLRVAHCEDLACTTATLSTLDESGSVGFHTSVTIGGDGYGLISYYDATNVDLKVAHCDDVACTTATVSTLDSTGFVGGVTSVMTGSDGLGLISYSDATNGDLKVAHCDDAMCRTATLTRVDTVGTVGSFSSIARGTDGVGVIAYYDSSNKDLKIARCHDVACTASTLAGLDLPAADMWDVGGYPSIAIGTDGSGLTSYLDSTRRDLKLAHGTPIDLVMAEVTDPPATLVLGESFSVADVVENRGTDRVPESTTRYYLSLDALWSSGDRRLTGERNVPSLAPLEASSQGVTVGFPTGMAPGLYFLLACADDAKAFQESNEMNNCRASATRATLLAPDLVGTEVSDPPVGLNRGATFSVSNRIENQGSAAAPSSTTRYFLSRDRVWSSDDRRLIGSAGLGPLAASAHAEQMAAVGVPADMVLGTYVLLACADGPKVQAEVSEGNNCAASAHSTTVTD